MPEKEQHTAISPWTQRCGQCWDYGSGHLNLLQLSSLSKNPAFQM